MLKYHRFLRCCNKSNLHALPVVSKLASISTLLATELETLLSLLQAYPAKLLALHSTCEQSISVNSCVCYNPVAPGTPL